MKKAKVNMQENGVGRAGGGTRGTVSAAQATRMAIF